MKVEDELDFNNSVFSATIIHDMKTPINLVLHFLGQIEDTN